MYYYLEKPNLYKYYAIYYIALINMTCYFSLNKCRVKCYDVCAHVYFLETMMYSKSKKNLYELNHPLPKKVQVDTSHRARFNHINKLATLAITYHWADRDPS